MKTKKRRSHLYANGRVAANGSSFEATPKTDGIVSFEPLRLPEANESWMVRAVGLAANGVDHFRRFWGNKFIQKKGARQVLLRRALQVEEWLLAEAKQAYCRIGAKPGHAGDEKRARGGQHGPFVLFLWTVLAFMLLVSWWNAARFALNETQSWLTAFLYSSPIVAIPLALKYFIDQTYGRTRSAVLAALAGVGSVSAFVFVVSFAAHFAKEPSLEDLTNLLQRNDLRIQLSSQLMLEVVISSAVFLWIQALTGTGCVADCFTTLEARKATIVSRICLLEKRRAKLEAKLQRFTATIEATIAKAEASRCSRVLNHLLKS